MQTFERHASRRRAGGGGSAIGARRFDGPMRRIESSSASRYRLPARGLETRSDGRRVLVARQLTYFSAREKDEGRRWRPRGRHGEGFSERVRLGERPTTGCTSTAGVNSTAFGA